MVKAPQAMHVDSNPLVVVVFFIHNGPNKNIVDFSHTIVILIENG